MERDNSISRHHLMFPAAEHNLRAESRLIRTTPSMIAPITRSEHDYLHDVVPIVPALGHNTLRAVFRLWDPTGDTYDDLDLLCLAIDKASSHERSHEIETALAQLTVKSLLLERTVLKEIGYK